MITAHKDQDHREESDWILRYDRTKALPCRSLSDERKDEIVQGLQWELAGYRPPKKFVRVQNNDAQKGRELHRARREALPVLPDPVRRPSAPIMGMHWPTSGEHWDDVEYERDYSRLGVLLYSAAKHSISMLKRACFDIQGEHTRNGIDQIQEAQHEAFIAYAVRGLSVDTHTDGLILDAIRKHFVPVLAACGPVHTHDRGRRSPYRIR